MTGRDILAVATGSLRGFRLRSGLTMLTMAIGVAAVVVLTGLGEGARRYVKEEFASLGTNLVIVIPGRSETAGGGLSLLVGATPRDLTVADAGALTRSAAVRRVAPISVGSALASAHGLEREAVVLGTNSELLEIRHWQLAQGKFLATGDMDRASPVCVLGAKIRRELFGSEPAIGQWLRVGDRRFRVTGILKSEGRSIGVDVEDLVIIPVASAQALFNTPALLRILVEVQHRESIPHVKDFIRETIRERHQGEEDITVITQDAVLATFDRIFRALTFTVAGIAAISLAVAGILVMNVMLISVSQRTAEIGLLKALGAAPRTILSLFLTEATVLSLLGAGLGVAAGELTSWLLASLYPVLPTQPPAWAIAAGMGVALVTGISFGILPARRAARLDAVQALARR